MQDELTQKDEALTPVESASNETADAAVADESVETAVTTEAALDLDGDEAGVPADRVPHRKSRTGLVVSDKMNKTITVLVKRRVQHPLYKKYFFKSKKYMAHDEENDCNIGDRVRIVETRPLSARKRWSLDSVLERAK